MSVLELAGCTNMDNDSIIFTYEPQIFYVGDDYMKCVLEKVCIDWSTRRIRGSVAVRPENNHPNIKKEIQRLPIWFSFDDIGGCLKV